MVLNIMIAVAQGIVGGAERINNLNKENTSTKSNTKKSLRETWKDCPNCGRLVKGNAIRCVYCNYYFNERKVMPRYKNTQNIESSYDDGSQDEDLNFKCYEDYKNDFCGHISTKLEEPANYCPNCNITFHNEEKFCKICQTKLIDKSKYDKSQKTKASKHNVTNNHDTKMDNPIDKSISSEDNSFEAEFAGKTKEELERELKIATVRYEDCLKCGDYMKVYYSSRKQYLESMLIKY